MIKRLREAFQLSAQRRAQKKRNALLLEKAGYKSDVEKILTWGADPNHSSRLGDTPLMKAARWKSTGCITLLLNAGAHIDAQDYRGRTALMHGIEDVSVVRELVYSGANVALQDVFGNTALTLAQALTDPASARFLERWSMATPNALMGHLLRTLVLDDRYSPADSVLQKVDRLLSLGAELNGRNTEGDSPLHVLMKVEKEHQLAQSDVAIGLVQRGADTSALDKKGRTPLEAARENGASWLTIRFLEEDAAQREEKSGRKPSRSQSSYAYRAQR